MIASIFNRIIIGIMMGRFNVSSNYCREFTNNSIISMPEDNIENIIDSQCGIRCARSTRSLEALMRVSWEKPPGSDGHFDERSNTAGSFIDLTRLGQLRDSIDGVYTCRLGNLSENVLHIGVYVSRPGEIKLNFTTATLFIDKSHYYSSTASDQPDSGKVFFLRTP